MKHTPRCAIAACLTLFAGLASASTSEDGGGFCNPEVEECIPPSGPSQPSLPAGVTESGIWQTNSPFGYNISGGLNAGQTYIFGGGAGSPYSGGLVTQANGSASSMSYQVQTTPTPSVSVSATGNYLGSTPDQIYATGHATAGMTLTYRVVLRADDLAAAQTISGLLATSGALATLSGSYSLVGSDYGRGDVFAGTGTNELDGSLADSFYLSCGTYGAPITSHSAGCGSGSFNLAVNFVDGSTYSDGNALDFVSLVTLSADAATGYNDGSGRADLGSMTAFIDPTITLASGIRAKLILGDGGNVANAGGVSPVPEPSQGALVLAGLGLLGLLGRRRGKTVGASW